MTCEYLCTSLSVISDYTITGPTPDFCNAGELTHLPLVPHICASVLDSGNGSEWIQVMAGRHIPSAPRNYPNSSWHIYNRHRHVSDAQNVRNCHKQVLHKKQFETVFWMFCNISFLSITFWKEIYFLFITSIKSFYCVITIEWAFDQLWIIIPFILSSLWVIIISILNILNLSETGSLYRFRI